MATRPGARGSAIAKRENEAMRHKDALHANNTLPEYDAIKLRVLDESVMCNECGEYVHRDNWQAHYDAHHAGISVPHILTVDEYNAFQTNEDTIAVGLKAFVDVGHALLDIKEGALYREQYASFEAYCRDRWNFGRHRGYQLMSAATVADNLLTIVNTDQLPANESQARALTPLPPEQQRQVWQFITATYETDVVTTGMVKALAETMQSVMVTGAVEDGDGSQVDVSELFKASVQDYADERRSRQKQHIEDNAKKSKVATLEGDIDDILDQMETLPGGKSYRVIIYAD